MRKTNSIQSSYNLDAERHWSRGNTVLQAAHTNKTTEFTISSWIHQYMQLLNEESDMFDTWNGEIEIMGNAID